MRSPIAQRSFWLVGTIFISCSSLQAQPPTTIEPPAQGLAKVQKSLDEISQDVRSVRDKPELDLSSVENAIESIGPKIDALQNQTPAAEEIERSNRDLQAQERMAHWAKQTFYVTVISIVLSVLGLVSVIYTISLNRRSADAAIQGLKQTKEAIDLNRQTSVRELRAYVAAIPNFIHAFEVGQLLNAKFLIANVGATPAHELCHRGDVVIAPEPLPDDYRFPQLTQLPTPPTVIHTDREMVGGIVGRQAITADHVVELKEGRARIYIYGEVFYKDAIANEARETKFCSFVRVDDKTMVKLTSGYKQADLKVEFTVAVSGNSAT